MNAWAVVLALTISPPVMPPDAADAYVELLILGEGPLPETFPPGVGHAVERFWTRHQLWLSAVDKDNWSDTRIRQEILWCRGAMDRVAGLPELDDVGYLPFAWQADAGLALCDQRLRELAAIREYMLVTDQVDGEISRVTRLRLYWSSVKTARWPGNAAGCKREAIAEARRLVGESAWFSCQWPGVAP